MFRREERREDREERREDRWEDKEERREDRFEDREERRWDKEERREDRFEDREVRNEVRVEDQFVRRMEPAVVVVDPYAAPAVVDYAVAAPMYGAPPLYGVPPVVGAAVAYDAARDVRADQWDAVARDEQREGFRDMRQADRLDDMGFDGLATAKRVDAVEDFGDARDARFMGDVERRW